MIITLRPSAARTSARFVHPTGEPPCLVICDGTTALVLRPADLPDGLADAAEFAQALVHVASQWESGCRRTHRAAEGDTMTTTQDPIRTAAHDGPGDLFCDDPVPVAVLVQEATDAGFVDWLADQIIQQCRRHGMALDGNDGLLRALAAAAQQPVTSRSAEPVTIVVTYHPTQQRTTVNCADPATTLATLRDVFLGLALTAGDPHPQVAIQRNGVTLGRY